MSTDTSIIEKIRKLLALADGNQNEHEREVAMKFAMDLLAKHNLTISLIEEGPDTEVLEIDGDFRLDPWIRVVLSAACKLYYTDYYISTRFEYDIWRGPRTLKIPVFVGTKENISVTMDMATWLMNSVRKESNRLYKAEFERRSFRLGAAHRVFERAHEIMEAEKQAPPAATGTSLMVLRNKLQQANRKHLDKLDLRLFKGRSVYLDDGAYSDGEAYGNEIGISERSGRVKGRLTASNAN